MLAPLGDLDALIGAVADLALVIDRDGIVADAWLGTVFEGRVGGEALVGQPWSETVLPESREKAKELLAGGLDGQVRTREVAQSVQGMGPVPLRVSAVPVDDTRMVIIARDVRPEAEMQQRLVSTQQAMDLEYRRLRRAGTAYRALFRVCTDAVLVVRDSDRQIVEVNPAAATLLGAPVEALRGKSLEDVFADESRDDLFTLLGAVEAGASSEVSLRPSGRDELEVTATASSFRQSGSLLMLFRFWRSDGHRQPAVAARRSRMLEALEALPDGFVVTDDELQVLNANPAFCELVQRSTEKTVVGVHLGRWLGRPGVDLKIITASMKEHGMIRDFSTVIRGEYGQSQEALVTAVEALDGEVPCYGFTIRSVETRMNEPEGSSILPKSADRLRSLVGRVSLKDIVQESTDLIEKLCIERALDVSGNNRAAAAALLGLSRQSLYSKLRRYRLGDYE
jgi:transcriptional regulator PpsR